MKLKQYPVINFNEIGAKKDYFGHTPYVEALNNQIDNYFADANNSEPFYLGIVGAWGSGKTTIVEKALGKYTSKDAKIFRYDAWKYENDSFRRTFLKDIADTAGVKKNKLVDSLYQDSSSETTTLFGLPRKIQFLIPIISAIMFIGAIVLYSLCFELIAQIITSVTWLADLIILLASSHKTITKSRLFSEEQFYECFMEIMSEVKEKKKIIFIDNLDRCNSDDFSETLSSIKSFFGLKQKIIYIIPYDDTQFSLIYKDRYPQSYSDKIFDSRIDIKENSSRSIINFVLSIFKDFSKEYGEILTNTVGAIFSFSKEKTPRSLLRAINNYINEYNLLAYKTSNICEQDINYLAKYTILKIDYKQLFDFVHNEAEIVKNLDEGIPRLDHLNDKDFNKKYNGLIEDDVVQFFTETRNLLPSSYNLFYDSSETFDMNQFISPDLEKSIKENDISKLIVLLKEDKYKKDYLAYVSSDVIYQSKHDIYKATYANELKQFLSLQEKGAITNSDFLSVFKETLQIPAPIVQSLIMTEIITFEELSQFLLLIDSAKVTEAYNHHILTSMHSDSFMKNLKATVFKAKFYSTFITNNMNAQEQKNFHTYISEIVTNGAFKDDDHVSLFSSPCADNITKEEWARVNNSVSFATNPLNESLILNYSIKQITKILAETNDATVFYQLLQRISTLSSLFVNDYVLNATLSMILTLRSNTTYSQYVSASYLSYHYKLYDLSEETLVLICDFFNYYNFTFLKQYLDGCANVDAVIFALSKQPTMLKIPTYPIDYIKKLTPQQLNEHINNITNLFMAFGSTHRNQFIQHFLDTDIGYLVQIYDNEEIPERKKEIRELIISQQLSIRQNTQIIKLYESDVASYMRLLTKYSDIDSLILIYNSTNKPEMLSKSIEKINDSIEANDTISDKEINSLVDLINSGKLSIDDSSNFNSKLKNRLDKEKYNEVFSRIDKTRIKNKKRNIK